MEKPNLSDKGFAMLIDSSVLQNMFEGKNEGKAGEVQDLLKKMKDSGAKEIKCVTPMSSFLRAIFLANSNVTIKEIQRTLSYLKIMPSFADFKDEKAVTNEVILAAKAMNGESLEDIKKTQKEMKKRNNIHK